jgi:hypothetical protein
MILKANRVNKLRNEFIFLFVDGSIHPKKNDGKLHHCA